jgi:hypothetical protein
MRKYIRVVGASLLLVSLQSALLAQKNFSNLPNVADKIESKIRELMPGWEKHEIQPGALPPPGSTTQAPGNDKLIIRQWDNFAQRERIIQKARSQGLEDKRVDDAQRVRIILARYDSQNEAIEAIRRYGLVKKGTQVHGLEDEAYVYGLSGDLVFQTGNIIVYVSAMVNKNIDPSTGINNLLDAARAGHAASAPLARGFAQHVAAVLRTL